MTVTYPNALKDIRLQDVIDAIDAGAGAGKIEIGTAGMALVLATIPLNDPSAIVAAGVLTLDNTPPPEDPIADATGTAAEARIRDSDDNDVVTGLSVGTGGQNIVMDSVSITAGQSVKINSGTITHG